MGIAQSLRSRVRHAKTSILNTAKLMSGNRVTASYHTEYRVVVKTPKFSLRQYGHDKKSGSHVLLVPPLMVTAEIYDMAPDLSAVLLLRDQGHAVWGLDFGTPD